MCFRVELHYLKFISFCFWSFFRLFVCTFLSLYIVSFFLPAFPWFDYFKLMLDIKNNIPIRKVQTFCIQNYHPTLCVGWGRTAQLMVYYREEAPANALVCFWLSSDKFLFLSFFYLCIYFDQIMNTILLTLFVWKIMERNREKQSRANNSFF